MITEHDIFAAYPKKGFEGFALSAIRIALQTTSANLLFECTRRFAESWRDCDLTECPYCYDWIRRKGYLDDSATFGPRRATKEPHNPERAIYADVDKARNAGRPDAQLEADVMRKI